MHPPPRAVYPFPFPSCGRVPVADLTLGHLSGHQGLVKFVYGATDPGGQVAPGARR